MSEYYSHDHEPSDSVTHVIFDVDGTILDTEELYNKAKLQVLSRHGASHLFTRELVSRTAGKQAEDVARMIIASCDLPLTPDQFIREVDTELRPLLASARLKPGVARLVTHLKQHRVPAAIATSSRKTNSRVKMSGHSELFSMFSHKVFGSDDPEVRRGKPGPDIFLVAARRFPDTPSPENCLVFEDSVSGVQGAIEAGMQVVMIPEHQVHPGATEVLDSLEQFNPVKYGLPAFEEEVDVVRHEDEESRDSLMTNDENSNDSIL